MLITLLTYVGSSFRSANLPNQQTTDAVNLVMPGQCNYAIYNYSKLS